MSKLSAMLKLVEEQAMRSKRHADDFNNRPRTMDWSDPNNPVRIDATPEPVGSLMQRHQSGISGRDLDYDESFLKRLSDVEKQKISDSFNATYAKETANIDRPMIDLFDYEGYPWVTSMADRTAAGDAMTSLSGVNFKNPVQRLGGQDHMLYGDALWASDKGPVSNVYNVANELKKQSGKNPLFMPFAMSGSGSDFAHMTGETMLEYARSNMGRAGLSDLNKAIKEIYPPFKGMRSKGLMDQWREMPTEARKGIQQMMDRDFRDKGGIGLSEVRLGLADPTQLEKTTGTMKNVGIIDPDFRPTPAGMSGHPSYNSRIEGSYAGELKPEQQDIHAWLLGHNRAADLGIDPTDIQKRFMHPKGVMVNTMGQLQTQGAMGGLLDYETLRKLEELGYR